MKELIGDICKVRLSKVNAGLQVLQGPMTVKLNNLSAAECNVIRPFFQGALDRFHLLASVRLCFMLRFAACSTLHLHFSMLRNIVCCTLHITDFVTCQMSVVTSCCMQMETTLYPGNDDFENEDLNAQPQRHMLATA